jgi:hypothetical protein
MKTMAAVFLMISTLSAGERKVLVEMFTNSHCGICPSAHSAINAYASTSPNAARVRYIYYHTTFPYSDDQLSLANTTEPNARNSYYNGPTSTPNTYFDGVNQGRTYTSFAASLNARMAVASPFDITLTGTKNGSSVSVTATISQSGTISNTDLVLHMIAVENTTYAGRNGVTPQNFVMRKMITPSGGDPFVMNAGFSKQVTHSAALNNVTSMNAVGVVVFLQSVSTKEVFQSEYISYGTLTGLESSVTVTPIDFSLEQNFPNPFNPSTSINFTVPRKAHVSLKVFDLLGNEVAGLVQQSMDAGTHRVQFSAAEYGLTSGVYLYRLQTGGRSLVRKMLLLQ